MTIYPKYKLGEKIYLNAFIFIDPETKIFFLCQGEIVTVPTKSIEEPFKVQIISVCHKSALVNLPPRLEALALAQSLLGKKIYRRSEQLFKELPPLYNQSGFQQPNSWTTLH